MNSSSGTSMFAARSHQIIAADRIRAVQVAFFLLILVFFGTVPGFAAEPNLLLNGDLSAGSAGMPDHWTKTRDAPPGALIWSHKQGTSATVEIATVNQYFSNLYWRQRVSLAQPGWYELRADVKTANSSTGAVIMIRGVHPRLLATQSNQNWTPMEVYFRITDPGEVVEIGCGIRATGAGRVLFRNLMLSSISGAPPFGSRELETSPVSEMPDSERKALGRVERAQLPPGVSLLREALNFKVMVTVLFILVALTWLDRRYAVVTSGREIQMRFLQDPEVLKSAVVAACLCLILMGTWLVTQVEFLPGHGFYAVERGVVAGDEPHYLIMINSLLLKHDLHVETLYDDVSRGGPEAGAIFRGILLEHPTVAVNRITGHRGMGTTKDGVWHRNTEPEFAPSSDVYEIPAHPPGFPVLMALAVAPMQPRAREVEPDVGFVLMLIAWLGVVATYFVGRQARMGRRCAMLAASILFLASPWLAYSRAYFAESSIGLALILGLWALLSDVPILAALAAAAAAAMKPAFALAGVGFLVEEVREKRWKGAIKIAFVLAMPALAILANNFWLHRRFLELSVQASFQLHQLLETLVNPVEGLLCYAPWTIFGFFACARSFLSLSEDSRLARTIALPLFLYLVVLSSIGFGAGWCYGPRYWVAFLPWLALATVEGIRRSGPYLRAVCAVLVVFAVAIAIPGALRYPQLFYRPALDAWRAFY